MIEKGSINLGLVASIVLALVAGYVIISLIGKATSPKRATAADQAGNPVAAPTAPPKVGFQQTTAAPDTAEIADDPSTDAAND